MGVTITGITRISWDGRSYGFKKSEKAVDTYDQFVGAEVCLLDEQGRNIMSRFAKSVNGNEGNPIGIENYTLYAYQSSYEV